MLGQGGPSLEADPQVVAVPHRTEQGPDQLGPRLEGLASAIFCSFLLWAEAVNSPGHLAPNEQMFSGDNSPFMKTGVQFYTFCNGCVGQGRKKVGSEAQWTESSERLPVGFGLDEDVICRVQVRDGLAKSFSKNEVLSDEP